MVSHVDPKVRTIATLVFTHGFMTLSPLLASSVATIFALASTPGDAPFAPVPALVPAPVPAWAPPSAPASATAPGPDTAAIRQAAEQVTRAQRLVDNARFVDAVAAYGQAAALVPAFSPWAQVLAASALAEAGDTAGVRRMHEAAGDPELVREWGWNALPTAHLAMGDTAAAMGRLDAARGRIASPDRRAQATHRMAALQHARGQREAAATYREVVDASPGSRTGLAAAVALADSVGLASADRLPVARVFLRHGDFPRALPLLEQEIAANPQRDGALRLEAGRALWTARRYADAERWLTPPRPPAGGVAAADEVRAERVLFLGRTQYRDGRQTAALATFRRVIAEHPGTAAAGRAHYLLADLAHDDGNRAEARTHYEAAVRAGGEDAALSAMRLMTLHWSAGDRARALEVLRTGGDPDVATFDGQQRAYWLARAGAPEGPRLLESLWQTAPFTYYGMRAAEALGRTDELGSRIRPWTGAVPPAAVRHASDIADRAAVLTGAGRVVGASWEVGRALEAEGAPVLYALGEALHDRLLPGPGVRVGRALQRQEGSWNDALLRLVYPFPYRATIEREARRNNVDPYLVAGLIRQESGFDTSARSPAGALGLMQIMPATGTSLARELGVAGFRTARLTEPELNLRMGTRYLATMLARYDGRLGDALVAYNAGPTRMARWRGFPEHGDPELFVERIPFAETRGYVRIVQANTAIYRALYGAR
jgi:soluble lytic murein transglycosylase